MRILNRRIVAWGSEIQAKFCHLIMYVSLCICAGLAYIDDDQHICVLWIHQPSLYSMYIIKQHLYIISKFVFSQIQFLFNQYFLYKNIPPKQNHNFGICMVILEKTWVEIVRLQRCPFCKKFINLLKHALALLFLNILTPALGPKGPPRSNNAVCYSKLKILVIY